MSGNTIHVAVFVKVTVCRSLGLRQTGSWNDIPKVVCR